jgi:hypothetical protein
MGWGSAKLNSFSVFANSHRHHQRQLKYKINTIIKLAEKAIASHERLLAIAAKFKNWEEFGIVAVRPGDRHNRFVPTKEMTNKTIKPTR